MLVMKSALQPAGWLHREIREPLSFHPKAFSAVLERHTHHNAKLLSTAVRGQPQLLGARARCRKHCVVCALDEVSGGASYSLCILILVTVASKSVHLTHNTCIAAAKGV